MGDKEDIDGLGKGSENIEETPERAASEASNEAPDDYLDKIAGCPIDGPVDQTHPV
jgi:hypothetical protein